MDDDAGPGVQSVLHLAKEPATLGMHAALTLPRRQILAPGLAEILPTKARTFALAARFLPGPQHEATVVLYAFCRLMDDLVDEPAPGLSGGAIQARLEAWRCWLRDGGQTAPPAEPEHLGGALREV